MGLARAHALGRGEGLRLGERHGQCPRSAGFPPCLSRSCRITAPTAEDLIGVAAVDVPVATRQCRLKVRVPLWSKPPLSRL
jgi:hypothetical protein